VNNGDQAVSLIYLVGCLALVGSALMVRRLPIGHTLKMAGAWMLIFAAMFAVFALKDDFTALGRRLLAEGRGDAIQQGETLRIRRDEDGHFWVNASVNGSTVRFLVDSGASVTSIGKATAESAGIVPDAGFPVAVDTANGTIFVRRAVASKLTVGSIERRDFRIFVGQGGDEVNVLGMNFLSSLASWGTEDGWLVLRP
jgi:aspartyl protease family protein